MPPQPDPARRGRSPAGRGAGELGGASGPVARQDPAAVPLPRPLDPLEADLTQAASEPSEKSDPGRDLREREQAAIGELAEVERALAVLESRSPDAAVSVAYAKLLASARRRELRKTLAVTQRALLVRRRWRGFGLLVAGAAIFLVGLGSGRIATVVRTYLAARARAVEVVERAADPFRGAGYSVRELRADGDPRDVVAFEGTCLVVVAASAGGAARVTITRGAVVLDGEVSAGFCACADERVSVAATGVGAVEVRVLTVPASAVGGVDRLQAIEPRPAALAAGPADRACADSAFDEWARTALPSSPGTLTPEEQALVKYGLAAVGQTPSDRPFVVAPQRNEGCFLAVGRGRDDGLSLRLRGGERVAVPRGAPVGFCVRDATGLSVWREGRGVVTLFHAPRERLGGGLGLRELGARFGLRVRPWIPSDELAVDARAALVASGLASLIIEGGDAAATPLLAISTDARSTLAPTDVAIESACTPPPEVGATQTVCVEATPGTVGRAGLPAAVARARRPLWLPAPAEVAMPDLERTLAVMAFARRMSLLGFELTVLAGATATPTGASVAGRSGEREVVAIVVEPDPPYLHTLALVGEAWSFGGEPRFVPLAPGATVELRADPPYPRGKPPRREILVWRR